MRRYFCFFIYTILSNEEVSVIEKCVEQRGRSGCLRIKHQNFCIDYERICEINVIAPTELENIG